MLSALLLLAAVDWQAPTVLCRHDIQGKACVVTAAQSQGGRAPSSTPVPVASTSGKNAPPVRPAVNPGRGMAQRQPIVSQSFDKQV